MNPDDHDKNMQADVPMVDLPFYHWLETHDDPPGRLAPALSEYFDGKLGKMNQMEVESYKFILQHFWHNKRQPT